MTLAMLALVYGRMGGTAECERRIWKLVAFLGRYGHQPARECMSMPSGDMRELANGVAEIMREESDAMRRSSEG